VGSLAPQLCLMTPLFVADRLGVVPSSGAMDLHSGAAEMPEPPSVCSESDAGKPSADTLLCVYAM
jgi:hypothetical protein